MKIEIKALAIHEVGNRPNQEDYLWPVSVPRKDERLFIVCDGMGGHENGEVASKTVATAIGEWIEKNADGVLTDEMLKQALDVAYDRLDEQEQENGGGLRKMGTTLTLFYAGMQGVTVAHIGDSRIYHIRPGVGPLYISRDHSLVFDDYWMGKISYDEMATHPQKNVITKAITTGRDNRVTDLEKSICHISDIQKDDWFYLCSDGMLEQMTDEELTRILTSNASDADKRQELIEKTRDNNDNHTAWMLRVVGVKHEPGIEEFPVEEVRTFKYNALNRPVRNVVALEDESTLTQNSRRAIPYREEIPASQSANDVTIVGRGRKINSTQPKSKKGVSKLRIFLISLLTMLVLGWSGFFAYQKFFQHDNRFEKEIAQASESDPADAASIQQNISKEDSINIACSLLENKVLNEMQDSVLEDAEDLIKKIREELKDTTDNRNERVAEKRKKFVEWIKKELRKKVKIYGEH